MRILLGLLAALARKREPEPPTAKEMYQTEPLTLSEQSKRWEDAYSPEHIARIKAFLDVIAYAEGVERFSKDQCGYDVIVGGETFALYNDHPRRLVYLPRYKIGSTAAGRYQILSRYWDHYKAQLKLPDFSPNSQDLYCFQQFRERKAFDDVLNGRVEQAVTKCSNIWASFPGAGYGQRELKMSELVEHYKVRYLRHRELNGV
jgi:muramidase (phage lysozyme)